MPLREWIAEYMGSLGVPCDVDNIVITTGSQQALDFLGKLFISPGDPVLVTAPTYLGALQAFNAYEPSYETLELDGSPATAGFFRTGTNRHPALAYVVSDFGNPTGETLTLAQRERLLALSSELKVPLIEDAAYEAIRFSGERVRSLQALDIERVGSIEQSKVIYSGTFSKTIAPGFRVGWICAAKELVAKVVLTKQAADLHSSTLNQMIVHRVASTCFGEHVAMLNQVYGRRRDAMLAAMDESMPEGVQWTSPEGGMFVWVELPTGMDSAELLRTAIDEEGIAFVPGGSFFADRSGTNYLRLNYTLASEAIIKDGMQRLGQLINREIARGLMVESSLAAVGSS